MINHLFRSKLEIHPGFLDRLLKLFMKLRYLSYKTSTMNPLSAITTAADFTFCDIFPVFRKT